MKSGDFGLEFASLLPLMPFLINDTFVGFAKSHRRIRQGGPLSPFLFNIVMEVLYCLVVKAEEAGCLSGCRIGTKGPSILLLQFIEDSLFFLSKSETEVIHLRCILLMFEACSGHKVNFPKTKVYPINQE